MGMVLHSLRTHLAGSMRSLNLDLQQSWAGAAQVWRKLGKHTGLTKLVLDVGEEVRELGGVLHSAACIAAVLVVCCAHGSSICGV
jgi:hypothetical protein